MIGYYIHGRMALESDINTLSHGTASLDKTHAYIVLKSGGANGWGSFLIEGLTIEMHEVPG